MPTIEIQESGRQGPQRSLCTDKNGHPGFEYSSPCHTPGSISIFLKLSRMSGSWAVHLSADQTLEHALGHLATSCPGKDGFKQDHLLPNRWGF